jgi:anti-sigma B factor antagonist
MDQLSSTGGEGRLNFEFSREDDGSPVVRLNGELDMATAEELEAALQPLIDRHTRRLVMDASDLEFADSSAIALMVRLANAVEEVEIRQPRELLREVIKRMGLDERLRLVP